ncbi:hypothetical protein FIM09_03880 [SAR202 cluster bacterium AC-647-P02_OGT_505m]|nr:hypothetical protein [SAR202 cluster bacterium AC-647-P02_OGT_505m]
MKDSDIQKLIFSKMSPETTMRPLKDFKLNVSANTGFQKVFFSVRCLQEECDTAALLSVEIAMSKSDLEIENAVSSLVERLERQERSFYSMDCSMHGMMKTGVVDD